MCAALWWSASAVAAGFSAEQFLSVFEQNSVVEELEGAIDMARNHPDGKKSLHSLRRRLSEEKRKAAALMRDVKPLAMKAQSKKDINVQDARGRTLLMHACRYNSGSAVSMLLEEDADLSVVDKNGNSALYYDQQEGSGLLVSRLAAEAEEALESGNMDKVRLYCKAGLPLDVQLSDGPLLGCLLQKKQFSLAAELLSEGNLENMPMKDGTLLTELLVQSGQEDILKKAAGIFGKELWATSAGGMDSLLYVLRSGNLQALGLYVHHLGTGNNLCTLAVRHSSPELITWVLQKSEAVGKEDTWGSFPLFEAARRGNLPVFEAVLSAGGEVSARNNAGETVLMHAALSGSVELVNAVLEKMSADLVGTCDAAGRTAVDYARLSGNAEVESVLTKRGVQPGKQQ